MTIYYSTLALCALLGELSTGFFIHAACWLIAMVTVLGKVVIENMVSHR